MRDGDDIGWSVRLIDLNTLCVCVCACLVVCLCLISDLVNLEKCASHDDDGYDDRDRFWPKMKMSTI